MPKTTLRGRSVASVLLVAALIPLSGCIAGMGKAPAPYQDLYLESGSWSSHVDLGLPEPDVFIKRSGESGIWRPGPADILRADEAALYASAQTQAHDPSFTITGPFPQGKELPGTLARWLSASGSWAYACEHAKPGVFQTTLTGLLGDSLYSLWVERVRYNVGAVEASTWTPLDGDMGATSSFWSLPDGRASIRVPLDTCLPVPTLNDLETGVATQVVVVYHSDGQTYGEFPGAFGKTAHAQMLTRVTGSV